METEYALKSDGGGPRQWIPTVITENTRGKRQEEEMQWYAGM